MEKKLFNSLSGIKRYARLVLRKILPISLQKKLKHQLMGKVKFGNLRRLTPISRKFGFDRGKPIDRFYIENF